MIKEKEEMVGLFHLIYVDEVESTNTYLKDNYHLYQDYTVLIARNQTNGRGRYNRVWISEDDICFSILFKKPLEHALVAPLAIVNALEKYNCNVEIKWPNDIYLNQKKLSGILIEDLYEEQYKASIVGIGMNRTDKPAFNAIGLDPYIHASSEEIIKSILREYELLLMQSRQTILSAYKEHSMVLGKRVMYQGCEYTVMTITDDGNLVLLGLDQKLKTICSDEINIKEAIIEEKGK